MEAIQYNAALRIMTASAEIRFGGSSTTTLVYKTLLFLQKKSKLKLQSPKYLYSIISTHNMSYRTRQCSEILVVNSFVLDAPFFTS